MDYYVLTRAERRFRVWMLISAWMYAASGLFFLIAGMRIAPFVNLISERFLPSLPAYPLPERGPEGAFWLVLCLSMMAMITWICRAAYLDLRRNGRLVPILLLSKFCSSAFYLYFFISKGQLAHLVGFFTDVPLFLITLALWLPAAVKDKYIDETDEEIIAAIGDALLPRGGAFEPGYMDFRVACIEDARAMLAAQYPMARVVSRVLLRAIDAAPVYLSFRPATLRRLPLEERQRMLKRIETHRIAPLRLIFFAVKMFVSLPFFNREEAERAVGYYRAEEGR